MSTKASERTILIRIIENLLESRNDIMKSETFINRVAMKTVHTSPAVDILSEMKGMEHLDSDVRHSKLACCIELLAIVSHVIDLVSDELN